MSLAIFLHWNSNFCFAATKSLQGKTFPRRARNEYFIYANIPILEDESDIETEEPDMYAVILHNDHYTTMEFVVEILKNIFHRTLAEATQIMLDVHQKGSGKVGLYTYDIASTKVQKVRQKARSVGFPLKCSIQKD
jgi:ATP-dependent Clp protease adaptor protein ClpS